MSENQHHGQCRTSAFSTHLSKMSRWPRLLQESISSGTHEYARNSAYIRVRVYAQICTDGFMGGRVISLHT